MNGIGGATIPNFIQNHLTQLSWQLSNSPISDSLVYIHSLLHELTVKRVRCRLGDTIKMLHPNVNCCSFLQFWYELNVVFLFVQRSHERLSPPLIATKYFHVLKIHWGNDCGNRLMIFYYYINNRILLPWRVSRHVFIESAINRLIQWFSPKQA